jgi:hypothetical protein
MSFRFAVITAAAVTTDGDAVAVITMAGVITATDW